MTFNGECGGSDAAGDVFAAARWFGLLGNSSAKAVSMAEVEWRCDTWGSGRGRASWEDTALFALIAMRFDLPTSRNYDGRDELVVTVPTECVGDIVKLVAGIGLDCEGWPWVIPVGDDEEFGDEAYESKRLAAASAALGVPFEVLYEDGERLELLRLV